MRRRPFGSLQMLAMVWLPFGRDLNRLIREGVYDHQNSLLLSDIAP